jgi:hypothetical protein
VRSKEYHSFSRHAPHAGILQISELGLWKIFVASPPVRLPSLRARYHFLLAQAEAGVPRISPVSSQGAPMKPLQLNTNQGTKPLQLNTNQGTVTARYNNKKEPTPQVTALPGISTYWPLPLVSCRAMKPGAIPTASAVKNNHNRKVNVFPPLVELCL